LCRFGIEAFAAVGAPGLAHGDELVAALVPEGEALAGEVGNGLRCQSTMNPPISRPHPS
jgi:hypothetical protein